MRKVQRLKPADAGVFFTPPLVEGALIRRYKRFFADIRLSTGETVVAHCANTGRMAGLLAEGSSVWVQYKGTEGRKLAWSWELASQDGEIVGVNTTLPNRLVAESIAQGKIPALAGYLTVKREVRVGDSRLDVGLSDHPDHDGACFVEVKNVTMAVDGKALFPDAVTQRGLKHLNALIALVERGHRAVQFYLVQRSDCTSFGPAWEVDPAYAEALKLAAQSGVEIMVWEAHVSPRCVALVRPLPLCF